MTGPSDSEDDNDRFDWSEFAIPLIILAAGLIGVLAGVYFGDGAVMGLSLLVCGFGLYGMGEGLLGLLFHVAPKLGAGLLIVGACALAYALYYSYGLLVTG